MYVVHYLTLEPEPEVLYCIYFPSDQRARRFYDYLQSRQIPCDLLEYSPVSSGDSREFTEEHIRKMLGVWREFK